MSVNRPALPLQGVQDAEERRRLLAGLHGVKLGAVASRNVLLLDDVFRSGQTMNAIAELLLGNGGAASLRALPITRTRTHR